MVGAGAPGGVKEPCPWEEDDALNRAIVNTRDVRLAFIELSNVMQLKGCQQAQAAMLINLSGTFIPKALTLAQPEIT
jgi:hypothetical protein